LKSQANQNSGTGKQEKGDTGLNRVCIFIPSKADDSEQGKSGFKGFPKRPSL